MEPVYDRAQLLLERNQPNDVLMMLQPVLNQNFNDPYALELLGHALYQRGEFGMAANIYKQAHCLRPNPDVLTNLGACFKQVDDLRSAEETWDMALELQKKPHKRAELYANIGGCYTANGTPDKALHFYGKSLEIDPANKVTVYNTCWPYLECRNWAEGFKAFDAGFSCGVRSMRRYGDVPAVDITKSPEDMRAALIGKRVIVWGDQGLGDEIMAASCVPDLIRDAKEVTFDCHPRLRNLFARSFNIECTGTRKTSNIEWFRDRKFDIAVPITTLMTIYRSNQAWPGTAYLKAERKKHKRRGMPRIGVSWAGGVQSTRAHVRSMPLQVLSPMIRAIPSEWISLQYHDSASSEICRFEESHGIHVKHMPDTLLAQDYDKTASLVAGLDLVITVCTTVMHLAGALGVPCWVMTPNRAPWVMGIEGNDLPMYGSVRQFRQKKDEPDWTGVIARITHDLETSGGLLTSEQIAELDNITLSVEAAE